MAVVPEARPQTTGVLRHAASALNSVPRSRTEGIHKSIVLQRAVKRTNEILSKRAAP